MPLVVVLNSITSFPDLAALPRALGHESCWLEFPPEVLPLGRRLAPLTDRAAAVGHAGSFEWLAVSCRAPADVARRLAARFRHRGRLAGVLALDAKQRTLALGVAFGEGDIAVINLSAPDPGLVQRLDRATASGARGLGLAARLAEALAGESAGRRFFVAFRGALEQTSPGLTGQVRAQDRRDLALLQLTRVLFLYFVQAKGWLDRRPAFLRESLDDCLRRGRRVHRDLLRPLFFGTLNRRPAERGRARRFGRIPFLNGGLFEPHALERGWRGEIPNSIWRTVFDDVFERFDFTVNEAGPEGTVAPDMLGRVFEGVMQPNDRRASGTFYTPVRLVERVVDTVLTTLLAGRLGCSEDQANLLLDAPTTQAQALLSEITVLDPAVGSGAFLLGTLERLTRLLNRGEPRVETRRRILANNLFGVDLNPMAVRLAELRLWLAVIADDPAEQPEQVAPLPNLDGLIRQGDSLLDPIGLVGGLPLSPGAAGTAVADLRRRFVVAVGNDKREVARQLRRAETAAMQACLTQAEQRLEREIGELVAEARAPDLFGKPSGLGGTAARRLGEVRERRRDLRRWRRRLIRDGAVPWFQYESQFAEVFTRGGFDIVLGNPPWVRAEELPRELRARLSDRYRWWRGGTRGFSHQPDLAVAFIERGLELLTAGGVLGFLLPTKLATAGYATTARAGLVGRTRLHTVADLTQHEPEAFDATVYPMALIATKTDPPAHHLVRRQLGPDATGIVPQRRLAGGAPWVLLPPRLHEALDELRRSRCILGDLLAIQLGVKTGANPIFLDPPPDIEPVLIRWAIRGRDLRPFHAERRVRLLWTHDQRGGVRTTLPQGARRYLEGYDAELRERADYVAGPPWTLFRTRAACAPHRVVWADIGRRLSAVALTGPHDRELVPLNTCYVIALESVEAAKALTAWLNCSWIRAAARVVADPARGGFARYNARSVGSLPVCEGLLTDRILTELAERAARSALIQDELDAYCATLLDLSPAAQTALADVAGVRPGHRR